MTHIPDFGYRGEENTCLWCGKRLHNMKDTSTDVGRYEVGVTYMTYGEHRKLVQVHHLVWDHDTKRYRRPRPGEAIDRVHMVERVWDPPIPKTFNFEAPPNAFHAQVCAAAFGQRMAELGRRLQAKKD